MLVDANILIYAVDESSPFHHPARQWLQDGLNGPRRIGIPWQSLGAFVRIATNARAMTGPLSPEAAWRIVEGWLESPVVWVPTPGDGYRRILGRLIVGGHLSGNLVSDAQLAALSIEYGLTMVSADSDFARFAELRWINPLAAA